MTSINFVWSDLAINQNSQSFDFSTFKKNNSFRKYIYCVRVSPPIEYSGKVYKYIHFTRLSISNSVLSFDLANNDGMLDIPLKEPNYVFEMCKPGKFKHLILIYLLIRSHTLRSVQFQCIRES